MRIYEELFIIKPEAPEEEIDQLIEQMKSVISTAGGAIDKVDKWGKRRLAYRVDKYREGSYVLFQFTSGPEAVKEFERRLRVSDMVIKFLTVGSAGQRPTGGDKAVVTQKKQYFRRKKVCRFCVEKIDDINYKDVRLLNAFIAERGKIVPRRISGVCAPHQRRLSDAIKKARNIALLPFASSV